MTIILTYGEEILKIILKNANREISPKNSLLNDFDKFYHQDHTVKPNYYLS